MNRTERAIKRQNRKALERIKKEKRFHLETYREASFYSKERRKEELVESIAQEKSLPAWHRQIMNDYACKNKTKELKTA